MSLLVPGDGLTAPPRSPCAPKANEATEPSPWSCSCPLPLEPQPPDESGLNSELGKPEPPLMVSWSPSRPCPRHARTLSFSAAVLEAMPFVPAPKATQPLGGLPTLTCSLVAPGGPGPSQPLTPCPSHAGEPSLGGSASSHPGLGT